MIFGIEKPAENDIAEDETLYTNLIQFEMKLLKEMKTEPVITLDQLMDMTPQFCENLRFRKVIWEEINNQGPPRRVRNSPSGKLGRMGTMIAQADTHSPRDYSISE